ncbi:MAG: toll/interleukin-1 receptor domain-containing protein [Lachnospiraceae bacterium]|nr:toll/interleukin-1 receptor domain-containing protein [Lachnospiraceae bacterium]
METYDVFLSHANADKLSYVEDLKKSFDKLGIKVFYDKDSIEWGDKWKDKINNGLQNCRFGVIVISENFFDRKWTELELKELLSRQKESGQKLVLPILYNTTSDALYKKYKKLSEIQFLDASKYDIKDITIQLARILLAEQAKKEDADDNDAIFETLFDKMSGIEFYEWVDKLIQGDNQWVDDYDEDFIGWHNLSISGKYIPLIQQRKKEAGSKNAYVFGDEDLGYQYRINPLYYKDFCKYFDKHIRPQM